MRRRFPQSLVVVKFHRVVAVAVVVVAVAIVVAAYIPRCVVVVSVVRWTLEFFDLFISFESRLAE
jgi:hypothetical protein